MAVNYFIQHMGVGRFGYGDVVSLDDLGCKDGDRNLERLLNLGAIAETDSERHVAAESPGAPEDTRGYPNNGRAGATDEEIAQAATLDPATGMPGNDTDVAAARRQARKQAQTDTAAA